MCNILKTKKTATAKTMLICVGHGDCHELDGRELVESLFEGAYV